MLTSRQEKILQLIVTEYVKSVNPVGSKLICDELNCSSATVRNDMSTLEDLGYLQKTHVSSGRIPSEKGYRYYVDNLMEPKKMNGDDLLKLQLIFNKVFLFYWTFFLDDMDCLFVIFTHFLFVKCLRLFE